MTKDSSAGLLILHAVRITGFADAATIARRFRTDPAEAAVMLGDAEARGWVSHAAFAGLDGWSLTESGLVENERQLAAELATVGDAGEIRQVYRDFLPLNARLQQACTDWQLRPAPGGRLASNDHSDATWDAGVLAELVTIDHALVPLAARLGALLTRFRGYETRFAAALQRAQAGEGRWIDGSDIDSCHRIWFQLHEDLLATLGLRRGAES